MECVTVEIISKAKNNVIVSCIYRTPGSSISNFTEIISNLLQKVKNKRKNVILCGDYNINLMKYNCHNDTKEFVDTLFSCGLYPVINKPSRITEDSATLIDNFFINTVNCNVKRGLLINDTSDHLPIFVILEGMQVDHADITCSKYVRNVTTQNIEMLCECLRIQNWNDINNSTDVNISYDRFVIKFCELYDKSCPIKKITRRHRNIKPWLTKGLLNACKKKNSLYKNFIRTKDANDLKKYKLYKNKLTSILRHSEKMYYNMLLEKHKSDIKSTWKVLNNVIFFFFFFLGGGGGLCRFQHCTGHITTGSWKGRGNQYI